MKRALLILTVVVSAFIGAILGILFALRFIHISPSYASIEERQKSRLANFSDSTLGIAPEGLNFEVAAKLVTPAVVHVRTIYGPGNFSLNPFDQNPNPHAQSSGSGVIISDDGY